jgi:hypothetical protein
VRTSSAKVRVFDAATRAEIQRKKLAALEADNWVEDRPKDDDDDDYQDADSGDGVTATLPGAPPTQMPNGKRCARGRDGCGRSEAEESEEESQERQVQRRAKVQDITGMHTLKAKPSPVGGGARLKIFCSPRASGDYRRCAVRPLPELGAQLRLRCRGSLHLSEEELLPDHGAAWQVQVSNDGRVPGHAAGV